MIRWKDQRAKRAEAQVKHPWTGVTNEDLLARWDAGKQIWTCRMADLGPIHEQWIHAIGMEMLRAMGGEGVDDRGFAAAAALGPDGARWVLDVPGVRDLVAQAQPDGMQLAAAMNLAGMFARNGYASEMNMVPERRRILMSKAAPQRA